MATINGVWVFNSELNFDDIGLPFTENIKFIAFESSFSIYDTNEFSKIMIDQNHSIKIVSASVNPITIYSSINGWQDVRYKKITFSSETTISDDLYNWFTKNAVEQSGVSVHFADLYKYLAQYNLLPDATTEIDYYYNLTIDALIAKGSPTSFVDSESANIKDKIIKLFPKEPLIDTHFNEYCGTYSTTKGKWNSQDWCFKNSILQNYGSGGTNYNAYAKQAPYPIGILENNQCNLSDGGNLTVPTDFMAKKNSTWTISFITQEYKNRRPITKSFGRLARGSKDFPSIYWVNKRSDKYVGGFQVKLATDSRLLFNSATATTLKLPNDIQYYSGDEKVWKNSIGREEKKFSDKEEDEQKKDILITNIPESPTSTELLIYFKSDTNLNGGPFYNSKGLSAKPQPHHFVFRNAQDSGDKNWYVTLFIDGQPILRQKSNTSTFSDTFSIGDPDVKNNNLDYSMEDLIISDFQLWDISLTDKEIQVLYNMRKEESSE